MSQNTSSSTKTPGNPNGKAKARAGTARDEDVDEKVLRRRLQYKLHQRRHRAKQKQKVSTLELEVQSLAAEVDTLNRQRNNLLIENNFFASRGMTGGVPARVAMEYFRLFQYSASSMNGIDQQEQYLRAVMTSETVGPDYVGVDTVVTQWRLFCNFFAYTRYDPLAIDVATVGDLTAVVVDSIFSVRARRDGIITLYPSLNGDLGLTQKLSGSIINIQGKYRFTFDSNGIITWFSAEWDLVGALQQALGGLADVSTVLSGANISSSTGQIQVDEAPADEMKPRVDPRHNVEFLLS
ncbi:uncharacterized protein PITG_10798 [Phytophthora infestans T30-4]|uniref:BZIP domain-containing protein n=2 Tax=Phytophthora infestans TaxID=4787 RepID=D0NH40_PHYIT|nr:uncharacterized protein PITG_10798 [Phytophthora infestans T30-4]EEY58679.1 conserved hypothetical protein [Phytophthora infestans T30-4]KAF4144895.1 hypothetical protein GN958_ATG05913 [Phytophthora infestans]KAI9979967.1 hypothetical protein PInf_027058 [Phytophthora infestans]|eukprot:XP_002901623.1 conserved hypothetical protein [Phytophthora infestans T30-4]